MIIVPLAAVPNQTFSITLDGNAYDMAIFLCNNIMAMDIVRNNEIILLGARLVPDEPIIPYRYLEDGNFFFITDQFAYPYYTEFGTNQTLIYVSALELANIRAAS